MKRLLSQINKFIAYLWGKKSELRSINECDVLLAKVVMEIHRKRSHSKFVFVPLFSIYQIHPINRDNSLKTTENRINMLQVRKNDLLKNKKISKDELSQCLPSVSAIKAVRENKISYIAYEGNGRLVALQTVFSPADDIYIEIEEYYFSNSSKIIRRMNRIRRLHGLIAKDRVL